MSWLQSGFYQSGWFQSGWFQRVSSGAVATLQPPFFSDNIIKIVDCPNYNNLGCMIALHDGRRTPVLSSGFSFNSTNIFWFDWSDMLDYDEEISASDLAESVGFELIGKATGQNVRDSENFLHQKSNGLRVQFGSTAGRYKLTNTITTTRAGGATGRTLSRTVEVDVRAYV